MRDRDKILEDGLMPLNQNTSTERRNMPHQCTSYIIISYQYMSIIKPTWAWLDKTSEDPPCDRSRVMQLPTVHTNSCIFSLLLPGLELDDLNGHFDHGRSAFSAVTTSTLQSISTGWNMLESGKPGCHWLSLPPPDLFLFEEVSHISLEWCLHTDPSNGWDRRFEFWKLMPPNRVNGTPHSV